MVTHPLSVNSVPFQNTPICQTSSYTVVTFILKMKFEEIFLYFLKNLVVTAFHKDLVNNLVIYNTFCRSAHATQGLLIKIQSKPLVNVHLSPCDCPLCALSLCTQAHKFTRRQTVPNYCETSANLIREGFKQNKK